MHTIHAAPFQPHWPGVVPSAHLPVFVSQHSAGLQLHDSRAHVPLTHFTPVPEQATQSPPGLPHFVAVFGMQRPVRTSQQPAIVDPQLAQPGGTQIPETEEQTSLPVHGTHFVPEMPQLLADGASHFAELEQQPLHAPPILHTHVPVAVSQLRPSVVQSLQGSPAWPQ